MPGWSQRPLFKNPHNMMGGGFVGMPKGIPGYEQGSVVEEMPAYRQEQLAKEAEYQKEIEKTARLFSSSDPNRFRLPRDYESEIHWHAKNIAGGHQVPKEQVMQDLAKAIEAQRGAPKMRTGGIVGLQNGGMMPELFEGEEIVETNPMINAMAAQGGPGIASVSAAPAPEAMPERNVPNERGIIELALDAEEVEDVEPIVAIAKQEAQGRLDEEFNILKSTAKAEEATGNSPSFIIKSSMDDLARSARRIENEITEKYPEVPADANLISSDDLMPYREELVAIFQVPEVGSEEPLMDTAVMAKNEELIPGYQEGGLSYAPGEGPDTVYKRGRIKAGDWGPGKKDYFAPEDISWMSQYAYGRELIEAVNNNEISVEDAKRLLADKIGPTLSEISSTYDDPAGVKRERERQRKVERGKMDLYQLKEAAEAEKDRDTREEKFLEALIESEAAAERGRGPLGLGRQKGNTGLLGSIRQATGRGAAPGTGVDRTMLLLQNPEFANLLNQYEATKGPRQELEEIEVTAKKRGKYDEQTTDQGQKEQKEQKEQMGPFQYDDGPLSPLEQAAKDLKDTYGGAMDELSEQYRKNVGEYETKSSEQDEKMMELFDNIKGRIPEQARLRGRLSPFTGGGAQASIVRGLQGQRIEQDMLQTHDINMLKYWENRKNEVEARRNKDYEAMTSLAEKRLEILSAIDNTMLSGRDARELEQIKFENALQLELYKFNLDPANLTGDIKEIETKLIDQGFSGRKLTAAVVGIDPIRAAEYYPSLRGTKSFGTQSGKTNTYTFPELIRLYLGQPKDSSKPDGKKFTVEDIIGIWEEA